MAIKDSFTEPTRPAPQAAPQQQQQEAPKMQQPQEPLVGGISRINSLFKRSGRTDGGDTRAAEFLQVFNKIKTEAIKNQDLEEDFELVRFDRDQNRVAYSSILVLKVVNQGNNPFVVVRPLMIANNAFKLAPRVIDVNNGMTQERINVEVEVSDIFSPSYWNRIQEFLRQQYGFAGVPVYSVGCMAIPAEFDITDELTLKNVLVKSVNSIDDLKAKRNGEAPFSVNMVKGQDETLTARIDFSGRPTLTTLGNPVRSDMVISLNRTKNGNRQENEFYEADTEINQVSCMVNLEYAPTQQQNMFGQQPQQHQPPFTPAIVITDVRQAEWIKANTLELYLFALSNAFRSTAGQGWARCFLPQVGKSKDFNDIGALGYVSQLGKKIDTKTETFTDQNFAELMYSMVKPNPTFQIDLDRMGDSGLIHGIFMDAMGGVNKQAAQGAILQAVNNLIGGGFEQYFDFSKDIITSTGTEVALGYYYDGEEKRDRRDLDVLGALNASEGNQGEFMTWYATQCDLRIHPEVRLRQSKNFDRQYLGSVNYTNTAIRGTLSPDFIMGMDKAISAKGVIVAMDNVTMAFGAQRFDGNTTVQNYAVSGSANVSVGGVANQNGFSINTNGAGGNGFY